MYDHELTPEQVEFRDTVRDFVTHEVKPVVLHPERLQDFSARLPLPVIEQASRIGLRTFSLSEESGGAGADNVTASVVMEELGAGDVDVAMPLGQTSLLARFPFDGAMTGEQRRRFLPQFLEDDACHLALAPAAPDAALAWKYHREVERSAACRVKAVQQGNGDWTLNGEAGFVANAPLASLIVLQAKNTAGALVTLLVPRDTPGLSVRDLAADATPRDQPTVKWYHGAGGELTLRDCPVPGNNVILADRANALTAAAAASHPVFLAMNLGVGRAALQAGVEYARLRVQGARRIIEHQAIATILADAAVRIEVARAILRHAAWALDHPGECTDRGVFDLPLDAVARVYTSEAVYRATEEAAECFGDSGVMLDMPLPKYLRDARIFLHSRDSNTVARFRIAESLAGFVPSSVGAAAWEREEHSMSNLRLKDGIPTPRSRGTPGRGPPGMSGENLRELRILRGTNGPDGAAPAGALRRWIALAGLLMLAPAALAQPAWKPERPVEIVTGTTGGGADRMARLIQLLSREKKLVPAPVQVVAKVGAGNSIAYLYVSQKPADPHVLLASTLSLSVGHLTGRGKLGYRDFTPICILFDEYVAIYANANSPLKTGKDLVERLKADPSSLSIGLSSAAGSATHLAVAMVLRAAGVDVQKLRVVVFDSASRGIIAMMGGHVDISAASLSSGVAQLQAGTIRTLGITARQRMGGIYAQAPTWKELGADAWFSSYRGISAAKDISGPQIAYWENVFAAIDQDERWHEEGEKYLVHRQFRGSRETRKYLDDLDGPIKSLLTDLRLMK